MPLAMPPMDPSDGRAKACVLVSVRVMASIRVECAPFQQAHAETAIAVSTNMQSQDETRSAATREPKSSPPCNIESSREPRNQHTPIPHHRHKQKRPQSSGETVFGGAEGEGGGHAAGLTEPPGLANDPACAGGVALA